MMFSSKKSVLATTTVVVASFPLFCGRVWSFLPAATTVRDVVAIGRNNAWMISESDYQKPRGCHLLSFMAKKSVEEAMVSSSNEQNSNAFPVGTFVEFEEKNKRVRVGKIDKIERKTNGKARYDVKDGDGNLYKIADKSVSYAIKGVPTSPGPAQQMFREFEEARSSSIEQIRTELDVTPELLELAWEEALEDLNAFESSSASGSTSSEQTLTPSGFVKLVHSRTASKVEEYKAWRLLQSEEAHLFFKDIKDHGRISSFKIKTRKHVDGAKEAFCKDPNRAFDDLCLLSP